MINQKETKRLRCSIRKAILMGLPLLMLSLFCSCSAKSNPVIEQPFTETVELEKEPVPDINSVTLKDDKTVYAGDDDGSIVTMYLTVRRGNSADNTDHSWAEVNQYSVYDYVSMGVERYGVEAILQVGDENGPLAGELGYKALVPNAIVNVRGASTSKMPQKSYKISLMENAGTWKEQKTIALNKHVFDITRFRNKLSYDYIEQIPDMIGLRTQFVHLYVKDETNGASKTKFVDYGLFTQVEQPNTRYLKNHGLDSGGQLYKATFFEFLRYKGKLELITDSSYNEAEFNSILEVKGDEDHTKLLQMLEELNDYSKSIEDVFERYFDRENYLSWLAFNILSGNIDTQSRNFYLYSPTNSNTWYFLPWDCDESWSRYEDAVINGEEPGFEAGLSNYWSSTLHNRVLALPKYRALLDEKIQSLRKIMTPEKTKAMIDTYRPIVDKYIFSMPDNMYLRATKNEWDKVYNEIPYEVERNYALYLESLEKPMPFYLGVPEPVDGKKLKYLWNAAYDLDAEDITYKFELSRTYRFDHNIFEASDLKLPTITLDELPAGQYFYRVTATNESGYSQKAIDYYVDTHSDKHHGVVCFYVLENGDVIRGGSEME